VFAIYRHHGRIAICVGTPFGGSCYANSPRYGRAPISLGGPSLKVIESGIGSSNEVWALVRLSPGTSRLETTIPTGRAHQFMLSDGYAVVTFTNVRVGSMRYWPEHFGGFNVGVVTDFNMRNGGLVTGSDEIRVCSPSAPCDPAGRQSL
jgi:hypothetical protein